MYNIKSSVAFDPLCTLSLYYILCRVWYRWMQHDYEWWITGVWKEAAWTNFNWLLCIYTFRKTIHFSL